MRSNLQRQVQRRIPEQAERAVYVATSIIAGHAALTTPVDTSNLINSQYTRVFKAGTEVVGLVGYTARYAYFVHQAPGTLKGQARPDGRGNYWAPNGEPKFLERAGDDNRNEIDRAVFKAMRI